MRTEQNQLGLVEGADDQLYRETSPLIPPAAARSGPLRKSNVLPVYQLDELCDGFWSAAQTV
jgi:hypothetical protein